MATDEEKAQAEARAQLVAQRLQEDFYKAAYTNDLAGLLMATSKGVDINEIDEFGSTALHFAAQHGNLEACAMLLENGAKVDHKNKISSTPLHRAAREGHESVVKLLLEKGANVNHSSADGSTPLHLASEWDKPEMVRLLMTSGAKAETKNSDEKTPVDLAASAEVRHYLTKGPNVPYSGPTTPSSGSSAATGGGSMAAKFFGGPPTTPAPAPPKPAAAAPASPAPASPKPSGLSDQLKALNAAVEKLLDKSLTEKDIASSTRVAVDEIKKAVAVSKPSNPTGSGDLERSASEMVVQVKALLTAKAKNENLKAAEDGMARAVGKVKDFAAKVI